MADDAIVGIGDEALPPRVPALWLAQHMCPWGSGGEWIGLLL